MIADTKCNPLDYIKDNIKEDIKDFFHSLSKYDLPGWKRVKDIIVDLKISAPGHDGTYDFLVKEKCLPLLSL